MIVCHVKVKLENKKNKKPCKQFRKQSLKVESEEEEYEDDEEESPEASIVAQDVEVTPTPEKSLPDLSQFTIRPLVAPVKKTLYQTFQTNFS